MNRSTFVLLASLWLLFTGTTAEAGRPRGMQVLDSDFVLLPYIEQDDLFRVTYLRGGGSGDQALLLDESDTSPMRVTPLGFTAPLGSGMGSYTATPDGSTWAAFSSTQGIRVYDLGDLEQPGPLTPVLLQAAPMGAGFDPGSAQLGIIAILIGAVTEPSPALFLTSVRDGTSSLLVLGWNGNSFEAVEELGDGTWTWDRPQ